MKRTCYFVCLFVATGLVFNAQLRAENSLLSFYKNNSRTITALGARAVGIALLCSYLYSTQSGPRLPSGCIETTEQGKRLWAYEKNINGTSIKIYYEPDACKPDYGDGFITKQPVKFVVDPANSQIDPCGTLSLALFKAAQRSTGCTQTDWQLVLKNLGLNQLAVGKAILNNHNKVVITHDQNLASKIIHVVGPHNEAPQRDTLLEQAYQAPLEQIKDKPDATIAIPLISGSAFGVAPSHTAKIGYQACAQFLQQTPSGQHSVKEINLHMFRDFEAFTTVYNEIKR